MIRLITVAAVGLVLAGCTPSPLYTGSRRVVAGPEVPRDARGEPILGEIRPMPDAAPPAKRARTHRSGHWFGLF